MGVIIIFGYRIHDLMKIYYAGPLFSQAEIEFNVKVASQLRTAGFEVFLPQEHSDIEKIPENDEERRTLMKGFFRADLKAIDESDVLLMIMDGRVPDEGACFELGYAYAKGKRCVGLKTDVRVSEFGQDNAMLLGSIGDYLTDNVDALISLLKQLN